MRAADREQAIIEEAVRFFAEHGFEGQTRELAKRMGITHSAIYRYIPSKEALIERVYEHVYLSRWKTEWADLVADRSRPLEARLVQFYLEYVERIFDYCWVRIFAFSGLKSFDLPSRYLTIVRAQIILPACAELRAELGLPSPDEIAVSERETELFWGLHGRIFYLAIRRYVYGTTIPENLEPIVRDAVRSFRGGVGPVLKDILAEAAKASPRGA
ncbi:TetR/AcrR family transcriptional regulator [Xanthobacter dioxanivorans]|uniref:TetR/AcrR family transcriptional regulator n=1 Tax=Xanthobacter dioxanivorans TaxID=2528964 RepID=A0A974PMQ2_9HYPH|nr:TetR/AcrR family transcriptional regulator [Xanthobacter dioxanivorans]QRG06031.1 TetR/AcrR family transcriptional regulator [Xanthobacter dioxanivorans]